MLEMVFFANSGTETVEAALKLARISTGRSGLLHCEGSFHGNRSARYRLPATRTTKNRLDHCCRNAAQFDSAISTRSSELAATRHFAAFIVEPIQAEGGMIVPPDGYLRELKNFAAQRDVTDRRRSANRPRPNERHVCRRA